VGVCMGGGAQGVGDLGVWNLGAEGLGVLHGDLGVGGLYVLPGCL